MRVFDRTIARDHALFDGALVRVFQEHSNWTESTLQAPPFTIDHFRQHARRKFAEFLRKVPDEGLGKGIARQDYSDRRILLQHLAHCFVRWWGMDIHTFRNDVQDIVRRMRINLFEILKVKKLFVIFENNPLRKHHSVKYEQTSEGIQPFIRMKEDDVTLTRYLAGPEPHMHGSPAINQYTLDRLKQVEPFLTEIDETYIRRTLGGLREQLRNALNGKVMQTLELQQSLLRLIADDWETTHASEENQAALGAIEEEVAAESGVEHIMEEPPATILHHCFSILLSAETIDDAAREKLLRRRPVLEFIMHSSLRRYEGEEEAELRERLGLFYKTILPVARAYFQKLDLKVGGLGHLGLVLISHSQDVGLEELQNRYLV